MFKAFVGKARGRVAEQDEPGEASRFLGRRWPSGLTKGAPHAERQSVSSTHGPAANSALILWEAWARLPWMTMQGGQSKRFFQVISRSGPRFPRPMGVVAAMLLAPALASAAITVGSWDPLCRGIELARGTADAAEVRIQKVTAVRVDLTAPGIEFFATPSNRDRPLETDGQLPSDFLIRHGLQIAVNASFFSPCCSTTIGEPKDVLGLKISNGTVVSPPLGSDRGMDVLLIDQSNKARFASTTSPIDLTGVWNAVSGGPTLLRGGVNLRTPTDSPPEPRTATGKSQDGRSLIFITIDGRQGAYSAGATLHETAQWLLRLGAFDGFNLDGGGSTALVCDDGAGGALLLNRPISGGIPGNERVNGSHLGVRARRLDAPCETEFAATLAGAHPLAYWRLGDLTGSRASDDIGDFDGTLLGGVTLGVPGALRNDSNTAARFDGAGSVIEVPHSPSLNVAGSFTVSAWARLTDPTNSFRAVISSRSLPQESGYIICSGPADTFGEPRWQFWTGGGASPWNHLGRNRDDLMVGPRVNVGVWTHVAGVFIDRSGPIPDASLGRNRFQGDMILFVNGKPVMSAENVWYAPARAFPLRLGAGANEKDGGDFWWAGDIDEVAIVGRALTTEEIAQLYAIGRFVEELCPAAPQLPGDCNQDGALDISDGICLLGYLFLGTMERLPCGNGTVSAPENIALLDSNGDTTVDISDALRVFMLLFFGAPPPVLGEGCVPIPGCPDGSTPCGE